MTIRFFELIKGYTAIMYKYITKTRHGSRYGVLVPRHYSHALTVVDELFEEALKLVPNLSKCDARVSTVKGTGYIDGCMALEFQVPLDIEVPSDYFEIDQVFAY